MGSDGILLGEGVLLDARPASFATRLLAGALDQLAPETTLVVTSDHGNTEDLSTRIHTRNPVPLLAVGPAAHAFAAVRSLDMLAPALLAALEEHP